MRCSCLWSTISSSSISPQSGPPLRSTPKWGCSTEFCLVCFLLYSPKLTVGERHFSVHCSMYLQCSWLIWIGSCHLRSQQLVITCPLSPLFEQCDARPRTTTQALLLFIVIGGLEASEYGNVDLEKSSKRSFHWQMVCLPLSSAFPLLRAAAMLATAAAHSSSFGWTLTTCLAFYLALLESWIKPLLSVTNLGAVVLTSAASRPSFYSGASTYPSASFPCTQLTKVPVKMMWMKFTEGTGQAFWPVSWQRNEGWAIMC